MAEVVPSHSRSRRGRRLLAAAAVAHASLLALWLAGVLGGLFFVTSQPDTRGDSLNAYYQAGVNLRLGLSPYADPAALGPAVRVAPSQSGFRYMPPLAWVFAQLSRVASPQTLYWMWVALLEATLLGCAWLTLRVRALGPRRYAAAAMWLVFTPFLAELHLGQASTLIAAGLLVLLLDALGQNPLGSGRATRALAAAAWAGTILLKAFTGLLAVAYARAGRRAFILGGLALVAAATGAYFVSHPEDLRRYLSVNGAPFIGVLFPGMAGFQGLMRSIADHTLPEALRIAQVTLGPLQLSGANLPSALACSAAVAVAVWGTARLGRDDLFRGLSLWVSVFFLLYRQVWEYHYLMLLPVVSCAYLATGARWAVIAWAIMAAPTPFALMARLAGPQEASAWWILHHAAKPAAALLVFAAAVPWRLPVAAVEPRLEPVPAATPSPVAAVAATPALREEPELVGAGSSSVPGLQRAGSPASGVK